MSDIKHLFLLFTALLSLTVPAFEYSSFGLPCAADLYLQKQGFSLGYSHKYRQAVWVSYTLTAKNLKAKQVKRRNRFKKDPDVKFNPVRPKDYAKSGYDKGHIAPAADMTYSLPSMNSSFLMTNISPQIPGCNRGIWRRLETQIRHWALKEEKLHIITGPVFTAAPRSMGKTAIAVPTAFYKIVLDLTPPMKMIGFIVPNRTSKRRVFSFALSVDEVERITGYDFFSELDDDIEEKLERSIDFKLWQKQPGP